MRRVTKLFNTKAASIDEATKSVTFKISDNQPDRMGEIVDQKSWDFKSYLSNPIVLWGHNPDEPENVLGSATSLDIAADGSSTNATLRFDSDINPKAGLVFNQIKAGTLRTVSVGFIPHSEAVENDVPVLKDNELLEISVVPIPANPRAVALSLKEGTLSRKDASWLMDSMKKEASLLEEQLKVNEPKEKNMTPEQAQAIIDGIAKLNETVTAQAAEITALKERVPEPETDEQKQAREEQEAADAKAAEEAANVAAGKNPDGSAKPGSNDQGGAEGDEFDEDAELTPELQAQIDAELAAEAA